MFSRTEAALLFGCLGLIAAGVFGPTMTQAAHLHEFADQRVLWGLPFAMDVLSNLPFVLAGVVGAHSLLRLPPRSLGNAQRAMAALFFAGLIVTAAGSVWYHLRPEDAGLAVDRHGMSVAFAGLLGLAGANRVSERAGTALGLSMLGLAPLAVQAWSATGNVLPWAVAQFGGMGLILGFAFLRPLSLALDVRWRLVILAYAAAKLLEAGDHLVFEATNQLVSGHTLKHLVAALAAWPVIDAIRSLRESRQNRAGDAASRTGHA